LESDVFTLPDARLISDPPLPLVIEPARNGIDAVAWAAEHRDPIRELLLRHGGIMFRGFTEGSVETFRSFIAAVSADPLPYMERSSPRHELTDHVYTSTDYPPRHRIPLHNEQSYNNNFPLRIFFHCVVPPGSEGATPVADCRKVYRRLSPSLRDRLEERDYLYVRHFDTGIGLSWQEAFQTDDRGEVERYCANNDIDFSWGSDGELTTRQRRPVSAQHPQTGEMTWFNHLTFFNVSTLGPDVAEAMLSMGKENLPNNTYYGDGADIEPAALDELRAAYDAETVVMPWQEGDIMMLDNMLVAHGREPYAPPRQIVVGMAEPWSRSGSNELRPLSSMNTEVRGSAATD
jgi:alpha-ketoglutarate-dependent taurine dioxygenase